MTWTEPVWLAKVTRPSTTGTTTMLEIVCPAPKLRFETPGSGRPCGWTVRYPPAEGAVTVTLSTTAVTPEEGTAGRTGDREADQTARGDGSGPGTQSAACVQ